MIKHIENTGFTAPSAHTLGNERRTVAVAQLVATAALALATLVAATVVSVGFARADVGTVIDNEDGLFAIAMILGLVFAAMGGLTMLSLPHKQHAPKPHAPARHHGHFA
jgi:Mg2+/citrate symporter